jgi:molybdate transport system substrate-binding protein
VGYGAVDPDGIAGLRILAAGMLRPGFEALGDAAPGGLRIDYANARDLAERIVGGEEVDVFASASPEHPRELRAAGLVGEPVAFASNSLVVAVPSGSEASGYEVLGEPGTRVVIEVAGIPLGDYTRELLGRLDDLSGPDEPSGRGFSSGVFANVVAEVQTVFEVADALLGGAADAAVLYATDVAAQAGRLRAIELPAEAAVGVTCVACVVESSGRRAQAEAWVGELVGGSAQAVLAAAGFGPPVVG